jgi:hypothetical protein
MDSVSEPGRLPDSTGSGQKRITIAIFFIPVTFYVIERVSNRRTEKTTAAPPRRAAQSEPALDA